MNLFEAEPVELVLSEGDGQVLVWVGLDGLSAITVDNADIPFVRDFDHVDFGFKCFGSVIESNAQLSYSVSGESSVGSSNRSLALTAGGRHRSIDCWGKNAKHIG